ncbi:MAG: glycosyltransferase [Phycisphaerales bacterium]|nr:glycosyltransferase [Phycisphaerales bacterium]
MRVLHVVSTMKQSGGVESFLGHTFRAIRRRNLPDLDIEVCYTLGDSRLSDAELEEMGIRTWGVRLGNNPLPFLRNFYRELRVRGPYDVVHAHLSNFCGPPMQCARRAGVPVRLSHYHNLTAGHRNDWPRRIYERWLNRQVLSNSTGIIALTYAGLRLWFPRHAETDPRMFVIRYGIDVAEFEAARARDEVRDELGIPRDVPLIGHVGRFNWQKNHARLIEAFARVLQERPEMRLLLVGDGDLRPQIERQVDDLGIRASVTFTGVRRDIPRVLSALDLFVFPSIVEGFGKALLEAQAAGLTVASSRIATSCEAVAPPFEPFSCPPEDVPGLASCMLRGLEAAGRDPSLAVQAREFARKFTTEASVDSMLAAWQVPGFVAPLDPFAPAGAASVR